MSGGGAGKKRPADEPAKDWQKTLEHVRKLAAVMRQVIPCVCLHFIRALAPWSRRNRFKMPMKNAVFDRTVLCLCESGGRGASERKKEEEKSSRSMRDKASKRTDVT